MSNTYSASNGVAGHAAEAPPVHIRTPLLHSAQLSRLASQTEYGEVSVYLKMEALQPSGSFKVRGLGRSIAKAAKRATGAAASSAATSFSDTPMHVISSSGGNAGLAAAYCARALGLPCTVYCPKTVENYVVDLLRAEDARVVVHGDAWDDCDEAARAQLQTDEQAGRAAYYVHPFEGEETVEGHSSMIDEFHQQLLDEGVPQGRPDAIMCSAGGAGLLHGILRGLERNFPAATNSTRPPQVIVSQCFGANSFGQSLTQARVQRQAWDDAALRPITLPAITSKATSLGARTCSLSAVRSAVRYGNVRCLSIEDEVAQDAAWKFARDYRVLVELACSCVVAPLYNAKRILSQIFAGDNDQAAVSALKHTDKKPCVLVLIVCGGSKINAETIEQYRLTGKGDEHLAHTRVTLDGRDI